jgi:(R,R)-butanediol dehydrogenase/meso-butanediol dehydrogenase/diacetyl reductase
VWIVAVGSTVLVSGAGPIGALTILAAKAAGASVLIVSQPNPNRRPIISQVAPYAVVVDPKSQNLLEVVRDLTEKGVDVAQECVGLEAPLNACVAAVRRAGKVVQIGQHIKRAAIDAMQSALKDITVKATWCYPVQVWPSIARLIASGRCPVEKVITARVDAAEVVTKGFEALLDPAGRHLKTLVRT